MQLTIKPELDLYNISLLTIDQIDALYTFECETWPAGARASKEILAQRIALNHWMIAAWDKERIIGILCWRRGSFNPNDMSAFPNNFNDFANVGNDAQYNAAYVYNLSVHPDFRGLPVARHLMRTAFTQYYDPHLAYLVGDGRCPSYNGSSNEIEHIRQNSDFKLAIDRHVQEKCPIDLKDYLRDPILRFYYRALDGHFIWTIKDFLPTDHASGGHRVIFFKPLK